MKISVITVAYKNSRVVVDLLNSIQRYNDIGDELEVIIVDNSPEDCRIEEAIKIAEYKGYKYIPTDNRGFGAGNNIGAKIAKGEILAFLNPDIILIEPIFKKILEKFANDDKLAWIGGQLLDAKRNKNCSFAYCFEYSYQSFIDIFVFWVKEYFGLFDSERMFLIGADIIIRKSIFEEIGHFDEMIFMYNEEADLAKRILGLGKGYKIQFQDDIKMVHLEGHSLLLISNEGAKRHFCSTIYYLKKHVENYENVIKEIYKFEKVKLNIDLLIRPQKAMSRKYYIELMEERFPEFKKL